MAQQVDVNQLLQAYSALQAQVASLQQQAKAREASVYISRNNNLTLTWRKQGVQRSFLIPSKRQDGSTWLRGGGIPATYSLGNGVITIQASLPVDVDEAKTFQDRFISQMVVTPSSPGRQPQGEQTTTAPAPVPQAPPIAPIPVPVAPVIVAPAIPTVDMDAIVAEAQSIMGTMGYKSLDEAVKAVKKARGIR